MKIRTQLITGFSLMAVLVILMQAIDHHSSRTAQEAENWVLHTHTVMAEAEKIGKLLVNMETGERGYLITGDESFLEPYHEADLLHEDTISQLQKQVSDHPAQVERLINIEKLIDRWDADVGKPLIEKRKSIALETPENAAETLAEIRAIVGSSAGKSIMDDIRQHIAEFIAVEEDLLEQRQQKTTTMQQRTQNILFGGTVLFVFFAVIITIIITRTIHKKVGGEPADIEAVALRIAHGDLEIDSTPHNETGILASVMVMLESLKKNHVEISQKNWLNKGITGLGDVMRGTKALDVLCEDIITFVVRHLDVQVGTFSLVSPDGSKLVLAGSCAYKGGPDAPTEFGFGEGLIGQAAQEKKRIIIKDVPENSLTITSALGEILPHSIVCSPLLYEGEVVGVIELGAMQAFTELQLEFLDQTAERIAIAINAAHSRERMKTLLEESQAQAEELQAQQEELKVANEELEQRSQELVTQQEELRVSNEELEEKNAELEVRSEEKEDERGER